MFENQKSRFTVNLLTALLTGSLAAAGGSAAASPPATFVPQEAADGDLFGTAVDIDGGLAAVGAYSTDLERDDAGAVYLFTLDAQGASKVATLSATDGELADSFGASVAVSDDSVLVGAPGVILAELNEGAAYLFERQGDTWTEVAKLRRETTGRNDMFGSAVALDGDVAVVGAPGADTAGTDSGTALAYERRAGKWEQVSALTPQSAGAGDRLGSAVAVAGDLILIGASGDVQTGEDPGNAYLFERTDEGWREVAHLEPSDGKGGDAFGDAVALTGDLAVVGARFADITGSDEGAAYVFERSADGWVEVAKLTAPVPADRDQFGHAVALAGEVALVGAPRFDEPARDSGGVWVFARGEDGWVTSQRLSPTSPEMYDEFGQAVAADGSMVVVGAPQDIPSSASAEIVTGTATLFQGIQ